MARVRGAKRGDAPCGRLLHRSSEGSGRGLTLAQRCPSVSQREDTDTQAPATEIRSGRLCIWMMGFACRSDLKVLAESATQHA